MVTLLSFLNKMITSFPRAMVYAIYYEGEELYQSMHMGDLGVYNTVYTVLLYTLAIKLYYNINTPNLVCRNYESYIYQHLLASHIILVQYYTNYRILLVPAGIIPRGIILILIPAGMTYMTY